MVSKFKTEKFMLFFVFFSISTLVFAQNDDYKWRLQLAIGVNNPIDNGEYPGYYTNYFNFPSVNAGIQYMFLSNLGIKLDAGFNRSSSAPESQEFKLSYSRINAQLVYDFSNTFGFLPKQIGVVAHAGPGISFTQPSGDYSDNHLSFVNVLAGVELHYGISESLTVYGDISYAYSTLKMGTYDEDYPEYSFYGDLLYASVGLSYSFGQSNNCYCYR